VDSNAGMKKASRWPMERVLFAMAGSVSLVGGLLALLVSPWFALLPVFAGLNQWLFVAFGACPASLILGRFTSLECAAETGR